MTQHATHTSTCCPWAGDGMGWDENNTPLKVTSTAIQQHNKNDPKTTSGEKSKDLDEVAEPRTTNKKTDLLSKSKLKPNVKTAIYICRAR